MLLLGTMRKIIRLIQRDGWLYTSKRIWAWLIAHSPLCHVFTFSYTEDTRLTFAATLLTYQLYANRNARGNERTWLTKQLQLGDTYIDVGANIGSLVIPAAAAVGPTGHVLAFEPSPKFAKVLKRNVELNNQIWVSVEPVALGANISTVYLNESVPDDTTNHIAGSGTTVSQAPLDSFTKEIESIKLLKIDVEGYECEVLRGANATLAKTEQLLIECIPRNLARSGATVPELLELLKPYFTLYIITPSGELTAFIYRADATEWPDLVGINHRYVEST